jgi:hypothetical protein
MSQQVRRIRVSASHPQTSGCRVVPLRRSEIRQRDDRDVPGRGMRFGTSIDGLVPAQHIHRVETLGAVGRCQAGHQRNKGQRGRDDSKRQRI